MGHDSLWDHQVLRKDIAKFCQDNCGSWEVRNALTDDGVEVHSVEIAKKMAERGWLGIGIPTEYGGQGGSLADMCCFLDEATRGGAPFGAYPASRIVASAYLKFANEEQKQSVLRGVANGEVKALALSEPESGSDLASISCRASSADSGYIINGLKVWTSNAHLADQILVLAQTGEPDGEASGLSMFQVDATAAGVRIEPIRTIAGRELNAVRFDSCFVPESALVGGLGSGWLQVMITLAFERLLISAVTLSLARRAFDDALDYLRHRSQFGQRVGKFQSLSHRIADLATELECCRLLVFDVAAKADRRSGRLLPQEVSMAKLKTTETAKRICVEGMQMMGAAGTRIDAEMEQHLRTSLLATLMGGTSEIQREIIAKSFGL